MEFAISEEEMRKGPPLTIDHMIFHQMMGDPKFYDGVPAFYFMKEQGLAIHQKIVDAILNQEAGCRGCSNVKDMVRPVFVIFAEQAFKLGQDNPDALKPLADYIAEKKGYLPKPILLYYKYKGIVHKLEL